jgi:uncharacterized membrane protein YphA (DoxX/SURF4 family)
VAFRFGVVYFTLYALATQIAGGLFLLPGAPLPALGTVWPMRSITEWWGDRVLGVAAPLVAGNSADTMFHWVQLSWLLIAAVAITAAWIGIDRGAGRARRDERVRRWFRLCLRLALAAQMFYYGMAKVIPSQFPPPGLVTLVEPVGASSLSDLLWTFVGAAPPYQLFTGLAELLAGVLLLTPVTATAGAIVALADMTQVFVLNMAYDFGLKQLSLHLVVMAAILLAPETRRLAAALAGRAVGPSSQPPLFASARANRTAVWLQVALGVYLMASFASLSLRYWYADGGGRAPRSSLYGIWNVDQLAIDDRVQEPALNDYDRRWRRVIFDTPRVAVFQRTDDSLAHFTASIDGGRRLSLRKRGSTTWGATFRIDRPAPDRLVLDGDMDGQRIRMRLSLVELDTFRLLESRFRWVRPPDPFAG